MGHHKPSGEKLDGTRNTGKIEIVFDDVSNGYYAFWYPPQAVGSGKTELDALRDIQQAIHFAVDTLIESNAKGG